MTNEELKLKTLCPILLGCDKNRVDLEKMLFKLKEYGISVINDVESADIILVQTCAFILPARQEAIQNILYAIKLKEINPEKKVIVSGCFPQKNLLELKSEFPEVDAFVTIANYPIIVNIIENIYGVKNTNVRASYCHERILTNQPHFSYLKIADGCDNCCGYCTIPRIRGRYKSTPMNDLLKEANKLVDTGVKELILVAQDVTRYGEDLYGENKLCELLTELTKIKKLKWVRLLYCYPEKVDKRLLDLIATNPKICKYIDIPLQHIDNDILLSMNRRVNEKKTRELFTLLKESYKDLRIRTTFIVGLPGETRTKFLKLKKFLNEYQLDFVGFFKFSKEENTKAFYMKKQVPNWIKSLRLKALEKTQYAIFEQNSKKYIGMTYDAIIDEFDEETGNYMARIECFAPDIDFVVEMTDQDLEIGEMYKIKILSYSNYIFKGEKI